jgi:UDP-galactopyranose mutase
MIYDFLIVGSGMFGATCAHELTKLGHKCLIIEKRDVIGGNCYTENIDGIHVHKHGPHIFHTNEKYLWDYINQFAEFNQYNHTVVANYKDKFFSLPFNLWTFNQMWGSKNEKDAKSIIEKQKFKGQITNLEQQAKSLIGDDIYNTLVKGYTEKQWNKSCDELPPYIIKRLPVRFTWNNSYFDDKYIGMPIGGYTQIFDKMLDGIDIKLGVDYFENKKELNSLSRKIIFTGEIDKFYDYQFGKLEYRSLTWEEKKLNEDNFQGVPVMNYTDKDIPYTRIIEHKWFDYQQQKGTIISFEYPQNYNGNNEPYYPIRDSKNISIYERYSELSKKEKDVYFGGRLGGYIYYDMHQIIASALKLVDKIR